MFVAVFRFQIEALPLVLFHKTRVNPSVPSSAMLFAV